jgi:hypothetical protein
MTRVLLFAFALSSLVLLGSSVSVNQLTKFCGEEPEICDDFEAQCAESEACADMQAQCEADPKACQKMANKLNACMRSGGNAAGCDAESLKALAEKNGLEIDEAAFEADLAEAQAAYDSATKKCFHGSATVETNMGPMRMDELARFGKDVQVATWDRQTGQRSLSPVRYWMHAEPETQATFVEIRSGGLQTLLTPLHLIYRSSACSGPVEAVFASRVQPGDCIYEGKQGFNPQTVLEVTMKEEQGIYAPLTETGSIVVDGVGASCFGTSENEAFQRFIFDYTLRAADGFKGLLPGSLLEKVFGVTESGKPVAALSWVLDAFAHAQTIFKI